MRNLGRTLSGCLLAAVFALSSLALPVTAGASDYYMDATAEPSGGDMLADAFLLRPVMLVGSVVTVATFVVTLPFSALGGNVKESADKLVVEPLKYTFVRPLGDI